MDADDYGREYVRDFIVEQLRDFVRDDLEADFDDVVQSVNGQPAFIFVDPYTGRRFRVTVEVDQ